MGASTVYILCCVAATAFAATQVQDVTARVPVTVYYESLCPDSIKFVTKQLYPTYKKFGQYLDLTLVPYGKSTQVRTEGGSWKFDCHHGPNECYGNKVQACALKHLEDMGDRVEFVNCVMDKVKPKSEDTYPGKKCADKLNLDYSAIENCTNSEAGNEELAKLGVMTTNFQTKLSNVPTIAFNNKYDKNDQKVAESNFMSALCSRIGGSNAPAECKNSAPSARAAILFTAVAAILCKIIA